MRILYFLLHTNFVAIFNPKGGATEPPRNFSFDYSYWSHTGVRLRLVEQTDSVIICNCMRWCVCVCVCVCVDTIIQTFSYMQYFSTTYVSSVKVHRQTVMAVLNLFVIRGDPSVMSSQCAHFAESSGTLINVSFDIYAIKQLDRNNSMATNSGGYGVKE